MDDKTMFQQAKYEYEEINRKWMNLHLIIITILSIIALIVEIVMFFILNSHQFLHISLFIYLKKYLLFPTFFNAICTVLCYIIVHKCKISHILKQYFLSLSFVAMCFVVTMVHSIFFSIYSIFAFAIILTIIYGDYYLTSATAVCSIFAEYISAVFTSWDSEKISHCYYSYDIAISLIILGSIYITCLFIIVFENQKQSVILNKDMERCRLQQQVLRDGLTGIFNKLALEKYFDLMLENHNHSTYHMTMFDLDNFKHLNDSLGHLKGDFAIKTFGNILQKNCNPNSIPFRFGGDEFCILFINQEEHDVIEFTKKVQSEYFDTMKPENKNFVFSVSAGIAAFHPGMSPKQLLEHADIALYRAKNQQKNSCSVYTKNSIL